MVSQLEDITVRLGDPFELRAEVTGQPTPMVGWMKGETKFIYKISYFINSDRKNVLPTNDLLITAKGGIYSLFVRSARKADQGVYR